MHGTTHSFKKTLCTVRPLCTELWNVQASSNFSVIAFWSNRVFYKKKNFGKIKSHEQNNGFKVEIFRKIENNLFPDNLCTSSRKIKPRIFSRWSRPWIFERSFLDLNMGRGTKLFCSIGGSYFVSFWLKPKCDASRPLYMELFIIY